MKFTGLFGSGGTLIDICGQYTAAGLVCPRGIGSAPVVGGAIDRIPLAALVHAAGRPSLDVPTTSDSSLNGRSAGAAILVSILYSNPGLFGDVEYSYHVSSDASATFSTSTTQLTTDAARRRRLDVAGVRVVISQAGTIGAFDVFSLLVNLAVGVGLFRASQYVTDLLAKYLLALRHVYAQYIEATSVDCEEAPAESTLCSRRNFTCSPTCAVSDLKTSKDLPRILAVSARCGCERDGWARTLFGHRYARPFATTTIWLTPSLQVGCVRAF